MCLLPITVVQESGNVSSIYFSDNPEEDVSAEETDKPSKAAKRKRPAEKRATKKKKSEQVFEHYPLFDVLNKWQPALFPFGFIMDMCF